MLEALKYFSGSTAFKCDKIASGQSESGNYNSKQKLELAKSLNQGLLANLSL